MTANGLFITGTGTGIGKTLLTATLTAQARAAGRAVTALNPVVSGFSMTDPTSDTALLAQAQDLPWSTATADRLSPLRFAAPLSPDMAAAREGRTLALAEVVAASRAAMPSAGTGLIEGVGGAFVPIDHSSTVADWIAALGLPALVVVGSYLGTLSHSIATVRAMRDRGLSVAALVVSQSAEEPVPLGETVAALERHVGEPVAVLPRLTGQQVPPDLTHLIDFAALPDPVGDD